VEALAREAVVVSEDAYDALQAERERSAVPTPRGDWIMGQRWEDLLFLSWPLSVERIRPLVPAGFEVDTFDGNAWISVVPMWMEKARFRGLPRLPLLNSFAEVNVRTYIRVGEHKAVLFISLDTQSHINVFIARHAFHLPYFYADVEMLRGQEVRFTSMRPGGVAAFEVKYRPAGPELTPVEGTFEHWLLERYSMGCLGHDDTMYRGDIQHDPWQFQQVEWSAERMDLIGVLGLGVETRQPVAIYSPFTDVALWAPVRV
jgi:hypothetical protein